MAQALASGLVYGKTAVRECLGRLTVIQEIVNADGIAVDEVHWLEIPAYGTEFTMDKHLAKCAEISGLAPMTQPVRVL